MTWLKWDAEYDSHPDIMAAGWEAAVVFERVCRISKRFDFRGKVPAKYMTLEYLHRLTGVPENVLKAGLASCLAAGLVTVTNSDVTVIPGWRNHQIDTTNAERQARHRDKVKEAAQEDSNALRNEVTSRVLESTREDKEISTSPAAPKKTGHTEWEICPNCHHVMTTDEQADGKCEKCREESA